MNKTQRYKPGMLRQETYDDILSLRWCDRSKARMTESMDSVVSRAIALLVSKGDAEAS